MTITILGYEVKGHVSLILFKVWSNIMEGRMQKLSKSDPELWGHDPEPAVIPQTKILGGDIVFVPLKQAILVTAYCLQLLE